MPPKKRAAKAKAEPANEKTEPATDVPAGETSGPPAVDDAQPAKASSASDPPKDETNNLNGDSSVAATQKTDSKPGQKSKKRKPAPEPETASKASRRTGRSSKPELSQQQLLNFLLSKDAEEVLRPDDEKKALQDRGEVRTYSSSPLNPFEELICAMILARPISHVLGLRSIRTVLNEPYNFTSAQTVKDAGEEKRHQAMWDAKTQHKGKTADQLGQAAHVVLDKFTSDDDKAGSGLKKVLTAHGGDVDQALKALKESITGLGDKGLDIFLRRVQWLPEWKGGYPYADGLSMDGLRNIGLTQDVDELVDAIEKHWSSLHTKHLAGDDTAAKKRRALVVVLERATGAHLGNKIQEVQQAAAQA